MRHNANDLHAARDGWHKRLDALNHDFDPAGSRAELRRQLQDLQRGARRGRVGEVLVRVGAFLLAAGLVEGALWALGVDLVSLYKTALTALAGIAAIYYAAIGYRRLIGADRVDQAVSYLQQSLELVSEQDQRFVLATCAAIHGLDRLAFRWADEVGRLSRLEFELLTAAARVHDRYEGLSRSALAA